jgi:hypothetical protein
MAARPALARLLVPLLVLGLAAALYFWPGFRAEPIVEVPDDVNACARNLREIYKGLLLLGVREKHPPTRSGVALLGDLIASGALEDTPANRAHLTCPGPGAAPVRADVDYRALETLTEADSAYAARDVEAFPLAKFPSGGPELEPLVACDNADGLNHAGCTNVLYSDGTVVTLLLAQEIERGHVPADAKTIKVGKGSPIADLRKLTQDHGARLSPAEDR